MRPVLFGRSSSHFTRITRIFAHELGVDCELSIVRDLMSTDPADYGGNPALKMPALMNARGMWFGALAVCRELARGPSAPARIVWPEDLTEPLLSNAQELVLTGMSTEVGIIMAKVGGAAPADAPQHQKAAKSLEGTVRWLDDHLVELRTSLDLTAPQRTLSFLEVSLFCFVTHLEFRDILSTEEFAKLTAFCDVFATRPSAEATRFRFDG